MLVYQRVSHKLLVYSIMFAPPKKVQLRDFFTIAVDRSIHCRDLTSKTAEGW
jgi:hypothetical protein